MSGHPEAKPYQPRRGPGRSPPLLQAEDPSEPAPAGEAEPEMEPQPEPEAGTMVQYEAQQEHVEYEEGDEEGEEEGEEEHENGAGGEAVPMAMDADPFAAAAAAHAHHAEMVPLPGVEAGGVPHPASNTLTLSFQGEVYVFESVSTEKVQAVLLLLGGREINTGAGSVPSSSAPYSKLNYPHRLASLMRFREKRKERNFDKKTRYSVRKEVALRMQRHRGQFTSSKPKADEAASNATSSDGSPNWAAVEGRPPSAAECHHCGCNSTSTPMMRRGPDGPRTLCNACGLMWANKGMMRDIPKGSDVPLQIVPQATKEFQNGTAEASGSDQRNPTAEETGAPPAANGHDLQS